MVLSNEPKNSIEDHERKLTPWALKVLMRLQPLSQNQNGSFKEIMGEWDVWAMEDNGPNPARWGVCTLCQNDGIRYANTIKNRFTHHTVGSIGSVCIQAFMENADVQLKLAHNEMLERSRVNWLEMIEAKSFSSGKFAKSIDDYFKRNSGITPRQLISLIKTGEQYTIPLPIGIYPVKLRRNKDKFQLKGMSPSDIDIIMPHLTDSQQRRYAE